MKMTMKRTRSRSEGGFTLVEFLVVAVLGAVVVMSTYQVVISNQRVYAAQQVQIQGQQSTRAGMDVLTGELREVSARGGDLVAMGEQSMSVRVLRAFGHVCETPTLSPATIEVRTTGRQFLAGDSVFIFADNNRRQFWDDVWLEGEVSTVAGGMACPDGAASQLLTLSDMTAAFTNDEVRVGAPVRAFQHFEYGLYEFGPDWYLGRRAPGASTPDPLVGPLESESGVRFTYLDSDGLETTVPTDVVQIQIALRSASEMRDSRGVQVRDSLVATVYTRN